MPTVVEGLRALATDAWPRPWRNAFALVVWIAAFVASFYAFSSLEPQSGVRLEVQGEYVVVADVAPWSVTDLQPGMIVILIDGMPLVDGPDMIAKPDPSFLEGLSLDYGRNVEAIYPEELVAYQAGLGASTYSYYQDNGWALDNSGTAVMLGVAILAVMGWFLASGGAGQGLAVLAIPIAVASSVPLVLLPLDLITPVGPVVATALLILALLPLADGIAARIDDPSSRRVVRLGAMAIGISLVGIAWVSASDGSNVVSGWRLLGVAAIPLLPAIVASRPRASALSEGGTGASRRIAESSELILIAFTPFIATLTLTFTEYDPLLWPILLWLAILLAATRFTVRPLLRVATRAQLQRDLVVAASEAERARLAADLHDDALQDLTLLVRRLDAAGDVEGAAQARAIADRLRDICGDLRLPILDDLGVGPALDWLVLRIERLAGGEVRLERTEGTRPPADIELAVFRVAQEALANAVKHGRPPIVVRYQATASGVSLSIDDAGPGIDAEARETATAGGHFGLLNMQQRAEAIGALLDVRRWPSGGTHVALEWRAG